MANNDFDKTRNDYQQYDLVTIFKASENRVLRHLHVATMAVVTNVDGDTVQCMPFPIREGTTANNIYAYNIGKTEFKVGDKVLVIFTDRDFRKNYNSATTSERSIGTTNDAKLHSIDYGVVIPIAKQYEGSIEALKEKVDNHISDSNNPHNVSKEQVGLGNVANQGMDTDPTKGSGKYVTSGGVYNSIESVKSDLNATNEVINQFEANYAKKDYVDGNFANKYDTNKAIESVSTKATNNESEIISIKENYITKALADETYAKDSETSKSISGLDTKISNTDGKVSALEKNVTSISSTLSTKQDNLSFGDGILNTNNLITIDFTKVQSKLSVGNGIIFSNDALSIDTSIVPTIEYLDLQGYAKATDVAKNTEAIAEIEKNYATSSSIGNGKVVIKQNGTEKGSFTMNQNGATEINLTDTNTHVAVVNNLISTDSMSALSAYQGNVLNGKISDTNKVVAGKQNAFTIGDGLTYVNDVLAVDTTKFVGYTDYTSKLSTIDSDISSLNGKITTINTDIASLKSSTSNNKKVLDTLNTKVSSLEEEVTANESSISIINTNISTLSKDVEDVTKKADTNVSSIESLTDIVKGHTSSISSLETRATSAENSISSLNTAVSDRYTKGEVDGKLGDKLSTVTMKPKYIFQCNGKHRFCKIATITTTASWANRPIIFECIGRGMNSQQVISVISDSQAVAGNTLYGCYKTTNDLVWALKNEGNGVCSLYCMCSEIWGNVQVVRVTWYAETNNVKMKMEGCDGFPDGCIFAKNVITASLADHASVADTANDIKYIPGVRFSVNKFVESLTKNLFGEDTSNSGHARITIVRADYETGVPDGIGILGGCGTGLAWYSTVDTGGFLSTNLGDNSLGKSATIGSIRGNSLDWWRYIVLSNNGSDIADQSVNYASNAGYANDAGTATTCSSTVLLKAEDTNLGAKIQSQYTSGSIGNVTYHQATWYVIGNDGETYNFGKMITTDNFNAKLTEALKTTKIEYSTRSDYATYIDNGTYDSTSISLSYDSDNTTSLKYRSYPKLTINSVTGYGVLEGNVYNHGSFQLAVSDNSNGIIYVRNVAKGGSTPSWVRLLTADDVVNSLDSSTTNVPLSAYQGKVLNGKITSINSKFSNYQPILNSSTGATMQWLSFKRGSSYSITGIYCTCVKMTISGGVGSQANANFTIDSDYQSSSSNGSWYFVAMPTGGGYVDTLAFGLDKSTSGTGGVLWGRRVYYSGVTTEYTFDIIAIRLY